MSATWLQSSKTNVAVSASANNFFALGTANAKLQGGFNEAFLKAVWRQAGVFSGMYANVVTNTAGTGGTLAYRLNGANGNQTIAVAASTTGEFRDTTHTDSISAGDSVNYNFASGTSTPNFETVAIQFNPTTITNRVNRFSANGSLSVIVPAPSYEGFAGDIATNTVERNAQYTNKITATISNLFLNISASTTGVGTVTSRKNTAVGNLTISITSGTTGNFEDTTHSDSVVSGDLINYSYAKSSGTSFNITNIEVDQTSTAEQQHFIATNPPGSSISFSATLYAALAGAVSGGSTESSFKSTPILQFTWSNLEAYAATNTLNVTTTIVSRLSGVTGNQTISFAATTSGYAEDTTHSDSVTTANSINYFLSNGAGAGAIGLCSLGSLATYPAPEVITVDKWIGYEPDTVRKFRPNNPEGISIFPISVVPSNIIPQYDWETCFTDVLPGRKLGFPLRVPEFSAYPFGIVTKEVIYPDKWNPSRPDFVRAAKRDYYDGWSYHPWGLNYAPPIFPDMWLPSYPDFARAAKPNVREGQNAYPFGIVTKEVVYIDKWNPSYPDIARRDLMARRPNVPEGKFVYPVAVVTNEIVYPDKWTPSYPDFSRKYKPLVSEGWRAYPFGIVTKEVIYPDKWTPSYPDFARRAKPLVPEGRYAWPVSFAAIVPTFLDRWQPQYPNYIWKPARLHAGLQLITKPTFIQSFQILYFSEDDLFNFFAT